MPQACRPDENYRSNVPSPKDFYVSAGAQFAMDMLFLPVAFVSKSFFKVSFIVLEDLMSYAYTFRYNLRSDKRTDECQLKNGGV